MKHLTGIFVFCAALSGILVHAGPTDPSDIVIGGDQHEEMACVYTGDPYYKANQAVAGISHVGDLGIFCTGFLISPNNYFLTANHCLLYAPQDLRFRFNYQRTSCSSTATVNESTDYLGATLIAQYPELDVAILKINKNPATKFGFINLDFKYYNRQNIGDEVALIGHGNGWPKRIARKNNFAGNPCRVTQLWASVPEHTSYTSFGNDCDTLGGDSGGPILNKTQASPSGPVFAAAIGINYAGWGNMNYATAIPELESALAGVVPKPDSCWGRCGGIAPSGCHCGGCGGSPYAPPCCGDKFAHCGFL